MVLGFQVLFLKYAKSGCLVTVVRGGRQFLFFNFLFLACSTKWMTIFLCSIYTLNSSPQSSGSVHPGQVREEEVL